MGEVFGRRYGIRTGVLSVFQFAQTIAVYGFANWAPILLVHRGFTVVHSLGYSFMIALGRRRSALCCPFLLAERVERKTQIVIAAIGVGLFGTLFASADAHRAGHRRRNGHHAVQELAHRGVPSL